jgi:hypothetical protein
MSGRGRKSVGKSSTDAHVGGSGPHDTSPDLLGNDFAKQQLGARQQGAYKLGQHGAKKREQARLSEKFGQKVSGDTHESEHTIGFEPINQTTGLKRASGGRAGRLENEAPAYQESKAMHRAHIGTGTTTTADASGFDSHSYRDSQRTLLESGEVGAAVQLNQLGYAFLEDEKNNRMFQEETGWQKAAADESFRTMVSGMDEVTYGQGEEDVSVHVSPMEKVEMLASREAARTGEWPTRDTLREAWRTLGYVDPYEEDERTRVE